MGDAAYVGHVMPAVATSPVSVASLPKRVVESRGQRTPTLSAGYEPASELVTASLYHQ